MELLWILEATIAEYPNQAKLLATVAKKGDVEELMPPHIAKLRKELQEGGFLRSVPQRSPAVDFRLDGETAEYKSK